MTLVLKEGDYPLIDLIGNGVYCLGIKEEVREDDVIQLGPDGKVISRIPGNTRAHMSMEGTVTIHLGEIVES